MAAEGFYRREVDKMPYFDFSTEKFMFKRTWQVVFWGTRNDSGVPKQLAARLKARDGLHSKVVAPESRKRGTAPFQYGYPALVDKLGYSKFESIEYFSET